MAIATALVKSKLEATQLIKNSQSRLAERQPSVENFYQKAEDVITQPLELDVRLRNTLTERELSQLLQSKRPLIIALSSDNSGEKQLKESKIKDPSGISCAEIEQRQSSRDFFDIRDSALGNSVIRDTLVEEDSSGKNSFKTGSANTKDSAVPASAEISVAAEATDTQSIENTRIDDELVLEKVRDISEQRSESSEKTSHITSSENHSSSKVIVHKVVVKNGSEKSVKQSKLNENQRTTDDSSIPRTFDNRKEEEEISSSTSQRASRNGVDLSKKTSTKGAESSTTQTLSFSNVHGQPLRQIIHETFSPNRSRKVILDPFSIDHGPSRAIIHQISREEGVENVTRDKSSVIQHQVSKEEKHIANESVITQYSLPQTTDYKMIFHQITPSSNQESFLNTSGPTSPRSAEIFDNSSKLIDHSIFQHSRSLDQSSLYRQDDGQNQTKNSENHKKVIFIPILQENSTQTSPLPSFSENPLHSNLLEIIKDENDSENTHQTSASPLSRSPVICFENLSESFEIPKAPTEETSTSIQESEETTLPEKLTKTIEHPIVLEDTKRSSSRSPHRFEHLEPLTIPSFPVRRHAKVIVHPILHEASGKPIFPFSEKSMETIDNSSKKIANRILKEVSSELKSSSIVKTSSKEESIEETRTSFPVSLKNQGTIRPGFFETKTFEKEVNPLDNQAKVKIHHVSIAETTPERSNSQSANNLPPSPEKHKGNVFDQQILKEETGSGNQRLSAKQSKSTFEEKLFIHQISREESESSKVSEQRRSPKTPSSESKVIVHQIQKEEPNSGNQTSLSRSPSFPLAREVKSESTKNTVSSLQEPRSPPAKSFPVSAIKTQHPEQYNSKSTILEQKTINFKTLRNESKLRQSSSTITSPFSLTKLEHSNDQLISSDSNQNSPKVINHPIEQSQSTSSESSQSSFPMSAEKQRQSKFTTHSIFSDKSKPQQSCFPVSSGPTFPSSKEKEIHVTQYFRPPERKQQTIDLQFLRDSSEFRQSSSTVTSTFGTTEMVNKSVQPTEITNQVEKEKSSSYLQSEISDQPQTSSKSSSSDSFPTSNVKETHNVQYSRPQERLQETIDLQSLRESSKFHQSSSTMTSTYGLTEIEIKNGKEIIHKVFKEESSSDQSKSPASQTPLPSSSGSSFPLSDEKKIHATQYMRPQDRQQESIDLQSLRESSEFRQSSSTITSTFGLTKMQENKDSSQPKEIIHQIVKEEPSSDLPTQGLDHQISQDESVSSSEGSVLTAIHNDSPRSFSPTSADEPKDKELPKDKSLRTSFFLGSEASKVMNLPIARQFDRPLAYRVESPQPEKSPIIMKKSKSFDDDDIVIQEMSDTSSAGDTDNPPVISEAESETDTLEAIDDFPDTPSSSLLLSIQTLPIDHEDASMSPKSIQDYKIRRQQNRAALESHFLPQFLAPNFLDSIKEENSDLSDSERRSSCSDRLDPPTHHADLDDDVFLDPPKKANAVYPKSNLDFSKKHKHVLNVRPPKTGPIREEASPPSVVEAKIIDQGSIEESCSSWSTDLTPESEAAEVVYIDSASSSVSDLLELDYSQGQADDLIDVRIQTPTIDLGSVNEMFANCQTSESNDHIIYTPPSEKPPPPPPVNDQQNLLPIHKENHLPDITKQIISAEEQRKNRDEIIFEKIETMSAAPMDTHKIAEDVSATADRAENSNANNSNSCDSAIDQIVTNNTLPPPSSVSAVGSFANMENIREIVNASNSSSKKEKKSDTAAGLASSEASSPLTTKGEQASGDETDSSSIKKLRSLCTEALASMPYGEEVLEELATVSQTIREMPYPLPDLPQIQDIQLSLGSKPNKTSVIKLSQVPPRPPPMGQKFKSPPPPPVPEPPSKYDSWLGVPTESDPNVLVCLSPSQRNAVKSYSTADSLLDMHTKFVERRGYHEYTSKQVNAMNQANTSETQKLTKMDSPPPPPLPPRPPTQSANSNGNADINDDEEDQNNHRLLAIIRDTQEIQQQHQQQKSSMTSTTSENISRRTESATHQIGNTNSKDGGGSCLEGEFANPPASVSKQFPERKFVSESNQSQREMQQCQSEQSTKIGGESVMGMQFPTSGYFDSIFHGSNKRFSNIETGSTPGFCSQILATQPKRYSNIETSSFESKKCVENGKVVYDVSDSKREKISEGDQPGASAGIKTSFPELSKTKTNEGFPSVSTLNRSTNADSRPHIGGDSENIMSAFKLNTTQQTTANRVESSPPAPPVPPLPPTLSADTNATCSTSTTTKSTLKSESLINRTFNGEAVEKSLDDFRQHANEAAAGSSSNECTTKKLSAAFQHEKLFKDFDELSNLLNNELESGKRRPPATLNGNDIPSSVSDYNRVARESRIQSSHVSSTTSTETSRREQMKKLAEEIDQTAKQRQQHRREMRIPIMIEKSVGIGPRSAPELPQQPPSYDIPVRMESGHSIRPTLQHQRSYENHPTSSRQRTLSEHQSQHTTHEIPIHVEKPQPDRFRRAESMFNISDSTSSRHHMHHDDWMKYVGDLGSSENICKPFQREVEICYLGRRPNIRAPRMSASTSDLSSIHSYDTHGAYDVRRTTLTPRPQQPPRRAYLSTQSLIDTTPITPCVSSRRSPVPERRSSLPREIHDKQLKYITSKEQQLKYEFERLENERRQLIDEMNRAQINQRINREAYRQRQLPPLTEDESFRQQMAEEWLHKVAEREERRLQKIIKISKINQEAGVPVAPPRRHSTADDIGDEFLRRVKERRSKLCMPSDSDWESGAESQPIPRADGSRSENEEPPVTVFEGQSATNLRQLPKHLREFAKLTSQMKQEHREEMTENCSTSASKKTSQMTSVKTSNNHNSMHEPESMQQDAACGGRDLDQLSQHGKRPKLVTILRHKKPAESSGSGGAGSCQLTAGAQAATSGSNNATNSAIKRRKQTRFLLTPNRRSWSESDLLREIDKELVLAKGFLYANGVWTPKNQTPTSSRTNLSDIHPHNNNNSHSPSPAKNRSSENRSSSASGRNQKGIPTPPPPPLWTPQPERKQFRPVHFESPTLQRRYVQQQSSLNEVPSPPWSYTNTQPFPGYQSQSSANHNKKDTAISWPPPPPASAKEPPGPAIVNDPVVVEVEDDDDDDKDERFAPTTSIAEKIRSFERSNSNYELHRPLVRHNPHEKPAIIKPNEVIFSVKNEYMSEPETEYDKPKKMAQLSRRQYDGIGPTTKHGIPLVLRSEVKEPNQHEWYKRIFQTIHKQKNPGRYPYKSTGYMSEPEPNYDSDYSTVKYRTLERRRLQSTGTGTGTGTAIGTESRASTRTGHESQDETFYGTMPNPVKSGQGSYKVQPGRIENYITGHSSVSEKEKKEWWDEVMDIFNGQLDQQKLSPHYTEGNLSRALLKEQGYTSDSNLVFRKKDVPILQSPLSPVEQKQVYKSVQAGGQPPLLGFRKPAPEKPKDDDDVPTPTPPVPPTKGVPLPLDSNGSNNLESPNRYFESDVNIHYKTPIRYEYKDPIPEEELAIRQAETMQKLYQEERRRKYLQELQDMNSRRHTDNFTPSQKSPIPLNRYDDFKSDLAPKSPNSSNYPRTVARALYNFQGQTARELTFKKGDVIYIRRQIDRNWYEGEHNAMIGLLPSNYVELLTKDGIRQPPKKPSEGQARAKYNFQAQSGIELSLNKGEHVVLTRRVDENWYEGKIANRKGIFPVSYVEVLVDIGTDDKAGRLPATQSIITQSSSSMRPSLDTLRTNINNEFNSLTSNGQPPNGILRETRTLHKTEVLHVDTNTEPVAYRALYKYRPQNTDELELQEGDIVYVLEKCDDGWFVGTSQRSGCFGTFPGNYVERV